MIHSTEFHLIIQPFRFCNYEIYKRKIRIVTLCSIGIDSMFMKFDAQLSGLKVVRQLKKSNRHFTFLQNASDQHLALSQCRYIPEPFRVLINFQCQFISIDLMNVLYNILMNDS